MGFRVRHFEFEKSDFRIVIGDPENLSDIPKFGSISNIFQKFVFFDYFGRLESPAPGKLSFKDFARIMTKVTEK